MEDIFNTDPSIKSYLISGYAVRNLRKKFKIGFNRFCFRCGISTRTLSNIEKQASVIIRAETMRSLMIGFNLTRNGLRTRPVLHSKISKGAYTKSNPQLLVSNVSAKKMTVYVNEEIRRGILTYARSNNVSENQALLYIARSYLGITNDKMKFARNISTFDILATESI